MPVNAMKLAAVLLKKSGASNAMDYSNTNPISHVKCEVKTCIHYKDDECQADSITVQGAGACCKKDTECETFRRK